MFLDTDTELKGFGKVTQRKLLYYRLIALVSMDTDTGHRGWQKGLVALNSNPRRHGHIVFFGGKAADFRLHVARSEGELGGEVCLPEKKY